MLFTRMRKSPMTLRKFQLALAALLAVAVAVPAAAHHSDGRAEALGDSIMVKGTVSSFRWAHPHVLLLVAVQNADGLESDYTIVLPSPQEIKRAKGWTLSAFRPGDPVEINVYPSLTGGRQGECPVRCLVYLNEDLLTPQWDSEANTWRLPR
jgi:hypothetical protein